MNRFIALPSHLALSICLSFCLAASFGSSTAFAQIAANAGDDQTVDAGEACDALVPLDGTSTEVPEGESATFSCDRPVSRG